MIRRSISRFTGYVLLVALIVFAVAPVSAQEPDFSEVPTSGMETFFRWFRAAFDTLLPIALIAAGVSAGGLFVWIVGRFLINALRRLRGAGDGETELEDPLGGWDDETLKETGLNEDQIAGYRQRLGLIRQWDRDAPDSNRSIVAGADGKQYRRLTNWEMDFLLAKGLITDDKQRKDLNDLRAFTKDQRKRNFELVAPEKRDKRGRRKDKGVDLLGTNNRRSRRRRSDDFSLFETDRGSKRKRKREDAAFFDFGSAQRGRQREKNDTPFFGGGMFGGGETRRGSEINLTPVGGFDLFGGQQPRPRRRRR